MLSNSVLTAIPMYMMSMFQVPKYVFQKIDKRKFLWR